jgi:hypothetical protein
VPIWVGVRWVAVGLFPCWTNQEENCRHNPN